MTNEQKIRMRKKSLILIIVGVATALMIFIVLEMTQAYLTDRDAVPNVITVGSVRLEISEGNFTDHSVIAEGQKMEKAPQIINTGHNDEYVFFQIAVPKGNVTLLYESNVQDHNEGTPVGEQSVSELFKLLASATEERPTSDVSIDDNTQKIVFQYHNGDSTSDSKRAGWILLNSNDTGDDYNYYVFGYNKKLIAGNDTATNTTIPLFDEIQLKSFIEEEMTGDGAGVKVDVTAYGIQTDELGIDGLGDYLDETKLNAIWKILVGKQVNDDNGT